MSSGGESGDENDLEIILEGEEQGELEGNVDVEIVDNQLETNDIENQNDEDPENKDKQVVKPKRVIKNPQPKLNEQTIKGPRGLAAIEGYFERVKFKGRGYEEQDLSVLMKTYEYWCHRLFPKFPFDDCIARLEKLGTKKTTLTQIKRIRMDINFEDDEEKLLSDGEENDTAGFVDTPDTQFDQLLPSTNQITSQIITDEQLERIRQNKERAERLRQERLSKIRQKAQVNLGESSHLLHSPPNNVSTTFQFGESVPGCSTDQNMDHEAEHNEVPVSNSNVEDNSDNILTSVNSEENIAPKRTRRVIESDSEDDLPNVTTSNRSSVSNEVNESGNGSNNSIDKATSQFSNSVSGSKCQNDCKDIEYGSDEDDIENILSQINTKKYISNKKKHISSDSENDLINIDEDANIQNMESDTNKKINGATNEIQDTNNEGYSNNPNNQIKGQKIIAENVKEGEETETREDCVNQSLPTEEDESRHHNILEDTNSQNKLTKGPNEIEDATDGYVEEDDIDNILNSINTDNTSTQKKSIRENVKKGEETETIKDSVNHSLPTDKEAASIRDHNILEDTNSQNTFTKGKNELEDAADGYVEEDDIDNILNSINTEENSPKEKVVTENDNKSESNVISTYDTEPIKRGVNQSCGKKTENCDDDNMDVEN